MMTFTPLSSKAATTVQARNEASARRGWLYGVMQSLLVSWPLSWSHTREVERQLRGRSEDVWNAWSQGGFELQDSKAVCEAIQETGSWSKAWFVPDDALMIVLDLPFDGLMMAEFAGVCEDRWGVRLEPESLEQAATVGDVVRVVTQIRASGKGQV